MIKDIVKDEAVLVTKSEAFSDKDKNVIKDLLDTAKSYEEKCLGLAAIQIGAPVRCFVARNMTIEGHPFVVYTNPMIFKRSTKKYETEESCLSLEGSRKVTRNDWIEIMYTDINGKIKRAHLTGLTAEIVQHEYDHLSGKLI